MRRFFAMMRYSKRLLVATICLVVDICLILGLCVFDIIQFVQIRKNSALLSPVFIQVNIALLVLAGINLILLIIFVILRRKKERLDEIKQD